MTGFLPPRVRRAFSALLAAAIPLAGCATSSDKRVQPAAAGEWTARENVGEAIALLNRGEPDQARRILVRVIARQPGDAVATSLIRQIDTPPEQLLGTRHFPYVTREGDSMSELAQRFLRDPIMFYALARYNGIAAPGSLAPGMTLRIPGVAAAPSARKPGAAPASPPKAARPTPAAPQADPAQARRLRMAGLEQLNRGSVDRAVALLRRAAQLDPDNALIRGDLERAQRIRRTVRDN